MATESSNTFFLYDQTMSCMVSRELIQGSRPQNIPDIQDIQEIHDVQEIQNIQHVQEIQDIENIQENVGYSRY